MLLLEHLLLTLANSIELSFVLSSGTFDYLIFDHLSVLLHLFAILEFLDHIFLRLPLFLDLALHPRLSLLFFSYPIEAFCILIPYLLCLPLSELFFHLSTFL